MPQSIETTDALEFVINSQDISGIILAANLASTAVCIKCGICQCVVVCDGDVIFFDIPAPWPLPPPNQQPVHSVAQSNLVSGAQQS